MDFKDTQAIYLQIVDYMSEQILQNRWKEGDRIPSVRELAVFLEVNPNTVMRSYDALQNKEIIYNKRGIGFFVTDNSKKKIIRERKKEFLENDLPLIFKNMELLEMSVEELKKEYEKYNQNKAHENK